MTSDQLYRPGLLKPTAVAGGFSNRNAEGLCAPLSCTDLRKYAGMSLKHLSANGCARCSIVLYGSLCCMHPPTDCLIHLAHCSTIVFACRASRAPSQKKWCAGMLAADRHQDAGCLSASCGFSVVEQHSEPAQNSRVWRAESLTSCYDDKTSQSTGTHATWQPQPGWREA